MTQRYRYLTLAILSSIYIGCSSSSKPHKIEPDYNATKQFSLQKEFDRLWYFDAIDMGKSQKALGYNGSGVSITIMGEAVDSTHPDLKNRVLKQYNTFATKGEALAGEGKQPYGFDKMGYNDGHGTHIAGTIAAECDGKGLQGVACGSSLYVYDIGAYDSAEKFKLEGWSDEDNELKMFMLSFATALDHVTTQGKSKITTGSFNIESPYFPFEAGGVLEGLSTAEIIEKIKGSVDDIDLFLSKNFVSFQNEADKDTLINIYENVDDDKDMVLLEMVLSKSQEWKILEESVQRYQKSGGVYITTESNNIFHRTSVLNAMPTISQKVDKDLWISAVMIKPKTFTDETTTRKEIVASMSGGWENVINDCGKTAKEYCVLIPSYKVLSTMTDELKDPNDPLIMIDERGYQIYTGHSMGAPMIAAALALMQEKNKKLSLGFSMKELVKILKQNANRSFKGYDENKHGQGMLDVTKALKAMDK